MILDTRTWWQPECDVLKARVFVNGQEVAGVWYADTEAGIVKAYLLNRAGQYETRRSLDRRTIPQDWKVEYLGDGGVPDVGYGAMSRTFKGMVTIVWLNALAARRYFEEQAEMAAVAAAATSTRSAAVRA